MANKIDILIQGKDQFSRPAQQAQASAKGLGGAMGGLAKTAVAVGGGFVVAQLGMAGAKKALDATIGSAIKFESSMTKINTLVGISKDVTAEWTPKILDIGKATAQGPVKLADAMFVVTSAGVRGAESLEILEAAAKASAIGMGDTASIARTVTAAMQAFGDQGLTAARATDILVATVREGNLEASSLAGTLGRVLGPAAALGIKFEDLGAFIATYTRLGVSAEAASTGLLSVMNTMIKPTSQASEALAAAGISMEEIRQVAAGPEGLVGALDLLTQKFGGNVEELGKVVPNVRALSAVLGTAGVQAEALGDIQGNVANSTGILDEAMAGAAETTEFKLNQAMTELNIAMMELGTQALPVVSAAAAILSDMLSDLDAIVQATRGDTADLGATVREQNDDWRNWIGVTQSAQQAASLADEGIKSLTQSLFGGGGTTEALEVTSNATRDFIEEMVGVQRETREAGRTWRQVTPPIIKSLEDIEGAADETKKAIRDMMRATTVESAEAELALKNLELEAFNLENATGELSGAEADRLALINDELIPAQETVLEGIQLEIDAAGLLALANDKTLLSTESVIRGIKDEDAALGDLGVEARATIENAFKPLEDEWLEEHRILTEKLLPAVGDYQLALHAIPTSVSTRLSLTTPSIPTDLLALFGSGSVIVGQHGFHGTVNRPTAFVAGEGGQEERVDITPGGGEVGAVDLTGLVIELDGEVIGRLIDSRVGAQADLLMRGG